MMKFLTDEEILQHAASLKVPIPNELAQTTLTYTDSQLRAHLNGLVHAFEYVIGMYQPDKILVEVLGLTINIFCKLLVMRKEFNRALLEDIEG